MNTPISWIRDYVPELDVSAQEYSDRITLTGTKVEGYTVLNKNLSNIVVARIDQVEKHPDADKLVVCQLFVGDRTVQIVTGAPNVTGESVGKLVPAVLDGGKVAGGHGGEPAPEDGIEIRAGKLRGVDSYGMMCSIEELGSDKNFYPCAPENGIYFFPEALIEELGLKPGDDAIKALGMDDTVVEYEITSNRVDCYSVIGIAREAAATFGKELKLHDPRKTGNEENVADLLKVEVRDTRLCPRYMARMVKNIKLAPSPEWMQKRLRNSGIRPINNLVDITNFVMQEYGQPMHAYDYDTIENSTIIVECAGNDEKFRTLDGQERTLDDTVLMIKDAGRSIGIAGVMGGENSKITDSVKTVVFESANFDGINVRLSAKKAGLRTDASSIFEKGLDPANAEAAINRACELCEELGCGEVVGGVIDVYASPEETVRVKFEPEKINGLLGTEISADEMKRIFAKIDLGFDEDKKEVIVPSFRRDLHCMADLAEEVLRFHGYDKIEDTLPVGEATTGKLSFKLMCDEILRDAAEYHGFSHAMTYAFESPKAFDKLLIPEGDKLRDTVVISNPLGEDFSIMRTQPLNAILTSVAFNYNHRAECCRLYDLSNIYLPHELPLTDLPDEREQLTLCAYDKDIDFFTMKGVVEVAIRKLGMTERPEYDASSAQRHAYLHPGRRADILYKGTCIGYLGEIHPFVAKNYGFKDGTRVYAAVLDVPALLEFADFERKYTGIARFPAVSRDLSMLVPKDITAGGIEKMIRQRGGKLLEDLKLFDLYEGEQVEQGYKSMAYTLTLRAGDRTLTDDEVNSVMKKVLNGLSTMGIELRS